ncbi:uncharacterized protein [Macaca fascicularis]|uniref:Uncharacterized protein n=1 Tax=Macaca fascicularis TaxID=9541 RepID=Q9BGY8_MACFA|nr:hypothetical protein [Macaca fascicularis]
MEGENEEGPVCLSRGSVGSSGQGLRGGVCGAGTEWAGPSSRSSHRLTSYPEALNREACGDDGKPGSAAAARQQAGECVRGWRPGGPGRPWPLASQLAEPSNGPRGASLSPSPRRGPISPDP